PPAPTSTMERPTWSSENAPTATAATAARYVITAVASFSRPSPSSSVSRRRGKPSRSRTARAAAMSVGATIAPRTKAAAHERCGQPQRFREEREQARERAEDEEQLERAHGASSLVGPKAGRPRGRPASAALVTDHEEVAVVLGVDLPVSADGERGVGRAER